MTQISYREKPNGAWQRAVLEGDPFDICAAVHARLFSDSSAGQAAGSNGTVMTSERMATRTQPVRAAGVRDTL